MKHGSLESGLGGFDYAAEMIGWENIFHCEINPFCRTILNYYWPNAKSYADIFEFDGLPWRGKVDIITAGFPCQPFSHAGKRKGTDDDRHIWPENLRIIKEVQPPFVLAENVPGLLTIERGLVFETVCADLENEGYEVTPFIIPACATGAVHRRDRIWIVGHHPDNHERNARLSKIGLQKQIRGSDSDRAYPHIEIIRKRESEADFNGREEYKSFNRQSLRDGIITGTDIIADTIDAGLQRNEQRQAFKQGARASRSITECFKNESWIEAATRLCGLDDGAAGRLDTEAISKPKWRTESLKAYGNAIYWPVAYEIFKAIEQCSD